MFPPQTDRRGERLRPCMPSLSSFRPTCITGLHCHLTELDHEDGGNVVVIESGDKSGPKWTALLVLQEGRRTPSDTISPWGQVGGRLPPEPEDADSNRVRSKGYTTRAKRQ